MEIPNFDPRLQLPGHGIFVGASMSGKTRLVLHLLQEIDILNPMPQTVIMYYDQYQPVYQEVQNQLAMKGVEMILREGARLKLEDLEKRDHQTLVIIDDATEETSSSMDIAKITTNGRHKNVSLWLIWHSLYSKHPASRLITQNVSYFFFLPSVRLVSQIHTLDSQLRYKGALVSAYNMAVNSDDEHRYLLLDLSSTTPNSLRLRSCVTNLMKTSSQNVFLK